MDQSQVASNRQSGAGKVRSVTKIEIIQMKSGDSLGVETDAFYPFTLGCDKYAIESLCLLDPRSSHRGQSELVGRVAGRLVRDRAIQTRMPRPKQCRA